MRDSRVAGRKHLCLFRGLASVTISSLRRIRSAIAATTRIFLIGGTTPIIDHSLRFTDDGFFDLRSGLSVGAGVGTS